MFTDSIFGNIVEIRLMEYSKNPQRDIVSGYTRSVNLLGLNLAMQFTNKLRNAIQSIQGRMELLDNNENYIRFQIINKDNIEIGEVVVYR